MTVNTKKTIIEVDKEIQFNNVISFRKKMKSSEIKSEIDRFHAYVESEGASIIGPMISATFNSEVFEGIQVLDMEFLFPISKKITDTPEFKFKEEFHLVHAVYTRFSGDPAHLQSVYEDLANYIRSNNLQQITAAYNVNDKVKSSSNYPVIDIYIGVNPSKL